MHTNAQIRTPLRGVAALAALAGALVLGGCGDLVVPDYNNPGLESLQENPTPSMVRTAATGLLIGAQANIAGPNQYVSLLGILGRESYNFDGSEPRFITEMLAGPMSASGAFGGNLWGLRYRNIQNANLLLAALNNPKLTLPEAEKEGIRGFAKTMQALDYLLVINTRDTNGAVIDNNRSINEEPGPLESKQRVLEHVAKLLDEAQGHLQRGGSSFSFGMSSGFRGFNTPATFQRFNRALRARVAAYRGEYPVALAALSQSFLDLNAPLRTGVYYDYGIGAGEISNDLIAVTIYAHPSIVTDAERQPNGTLDRRVQEKVTRVTPITQQGITTDLRFTIYRSNADPVPIIRNEELILLRAEARWFTGDRAGALSDLNFIRQSAGGLAPTTLTAASSNTLFENELLQQRRYSLLFEGGHRWIDLRRFNRLGLLPRALPGHLIHARFPIPEAECLARGASSECSAGG